MKLLDEIKSMTEKVKTDSFNKIQAKIRAAANKGRTSISLNDTEYTDGDLSKLRREGFLVTPMGIGRILVRW